MEKPKSYKPMKSKSDYPSVSANQGTSEWGYISEGAGVEKDTVVSSINKSK